MSFLALLVPVAMLYYAHRLSADLAREWDRLPVSAPPSHVRKLPRDA